MQKKRKSLDMYVHFYFLDENSSELLCNIQDNNSNLF